jgi:hypothetical protein
VSDTGNKDQAICYRVGSLPRWTESSSHLKQGRGTAKGEFRADEGRKAQLRAHVVQIFKSQIRTTVMATRLQVPGYARISQE